MDRISKHSHSHPSQKSNFNRNLNDQYYLSNNELPLHINFLTQNMRYAPQGNTTYVFVPVPVPAPQNNLYYLPQESRNLSQQNYSIRHLPIQQRRSQSDRQPSSIDLASVPKAFSSLVSTSSTHTLTSCPSNSSIGSQTSITLNTPSCRPVEKNISNMVITELKTEAKKIYVLKEDKTHFKITTFLKIINQVFELQKIESNQQLFFYNIAKNIFQNFFEAIFYANITDKQKFEVFDEVVQLIVSDSNILLEIPQYQQLYCFLRMASLDHSYTASEMQNANLYSLYLSKSRQCNQVKFPNTISFQSLKFTIQRQQYALLEDYVDLNFVHQSDMSLFIDELVQSKLNQNFKNISEYKVVNRIFHKACDRLAASNEFSKKLVTVSKNYWKVITYLNYKDS